MNKPLLDWFTIVAQIINFLILVALLRHFLYGRIIAAMDERKKKISDQMAEGERLKSEAAGELGEYQRRVAELEQQRDSFLAKAHEEAEQEKKLLIQQSRKEVDEHKRRWQESLRQEMETTLTDLRDRLGDVVGRLVRKTLVELADVDLEERVINVFLRSLRDMDAEQRQRLSGSLEQSDRAFRVVSGFTMSNQQRQNVEETLREQFPALEKVEFEENGGVVCGISLNTPGHQMAWELGHRLENLVMELKQALSLENGKIAV